MHKDVHFEICSHQIREEQKTENDTTGISGQIVQNSGLRKAEERKRERDRWKPAEGEGSAGQPKCQSDRKARGDGGWQEYLYCSDNRKVVQAFLQRLLVREI